MTRILVPPFAGVLSAVGLALAPERREGLASFLVACDALPREQLGREIATLVTSLRAADGTTLSPQCWVRARYVGQGYELEIGVNAHDDGASIAQRFATTHEQRVGSADRPVECVSLRVSLVGERWLPGLRELSVMDPWRGYRRWRTRIDDGGRHGSLPMPRCM